MTLWKMTIAAAGSALALAACGNSSGGGGGASACNPTGGSSSGTGTKVVKVVSDPSTVGKYDPNPISVSVGQSVEWDFNDNSAPHTVTAEDMSFDSCSQTAGAKFVVTFNKAGDFKYHCTLHAQMLGNVKVS
ncbi:MAG: plastocyanin/azurin family copper-binding protein [Candidatus Dormibacteraeota bacterium]|nr:plastocyanin/azurin family copper-binding protein [Candidatus Dormibacteraeota bacterium]